MTHSFATISGDIAGDYVRVEATIEEDGSAKDLTGASVTWALFENEPAYTNGPLLDDSDSAITVSIADDATTGRVDIEIGTDATTGLSGTVYHRIRVEDADGRRQTWLGKHELEDADGA